MDIQIEREEFWLLLDLLGESVNWQQAKEWYTKEQLEQIQALYERLVEKHLLGR